MDNLEEIRDWLGAVEYLVTEETGCYGENDKGDYVRIENMCGGRYAKYDRDDEFVELTDDVLEAAMWLIKREKED